MISSHRSTILWIAFVAIAAADVVLPGPSFSVLCLPVFFAFLVLVRPKYPWPLASAAACFLIGAWLLEQGLRTGDGSDPLAPYRIADRLLITLAIFLVTAVHARLLRIHDAADPAGETGLAALKRGVLGLSVLLLLAVFVADAFTPRNWNLGTLYLLPVLSASALRRPLLLAGLVPVAAGLSVLGFLYGPPSSVLPEPSGVLLERAITILALLVSGAVLTAYFARDGKSERKPG